LRSPYGARLDSALSPRSSVVKVGKPRFNLQGNLLNESNLLSSAMPLADILGMLDPAARHANGWQDDGASKDSEGKMRFRGRSEPQIGKIGS
jgi:hypothetical protein